MTVDVKLMTLETSQDSARRDKMSDDFCKSVKQSKNKVLFIDGNLINGENIPEGYHPVGAMIECNAEFMIGVVTGIIDMHLNDVNDRNMNFLYHMAKHTIDKVIPHLEKYCASDEKESTTSTVLH